MAQNDLSISVTRRKVLLFILHLLMKLLLRCEITGLENVPLTGPLIVIINHIAFLDPVIVQGGFPRVGTPMAKVEAFELPVLGLFVKMYGAIPVRRGEGDMYAVKCALRVLRSGGVVLLAPEGTRSPTYQMQPGKDGAAMLALRSGAPILPVGVTGAHRIKAHWLKLKRSPVHLSVGQPFRLQAPTDHRRVSRTEMTAMTNEIMYRLAVQLPYEYRGVYSNVEEATGSYLVPEEI